MSIHLDDERTLLHAVTDLAADYLDRRITCRVGVSATPNDLTLALNRPLPETGTPAETVLRELVHDATPGLIASSGPRYFGFVMGGTTPAGRMADWLTSTWDQNAQVYATSPAAAVAEAVVAKWLLEILGLPSDSSVGLVTGCQMANFTALAVARNSLLDQAGWDLDRDGLFGAPPITVLMSECGHSTIRSALHMLGIGSAQTRPIAADSQGRMSLKELRREILRAEGRPLIVSVQAGNVHTGAFESIDAVADLVADRSAWVHVDGAFGLWAAVSPEMKRRLLPGYERADSWATDAHKWLNVPYESGIVVVKDRGRHRRFKTERCAYAGDETTNRRDGSTWAPENSRRARAFVIYAVLREMGRSGIQALVERCCKLARLCATEIAKVSGAAILNDVQLNQVLIRFQTPGNQNSVSFHEAIASHVQSEGECWLGATSWRGGGALRVSICSALTTEADIAVLVAAIARGAQRAVETDS